MEDNIASLNSLEIQAKIQRVALNNAKENLDIINNQYKAGTVDQSHLFSAEISYYNSEKTLNDLEGLKAITKVALIKALGGV